jgi:hypothetical protein
MPPRTVEVTLRFQREGCRSTTEPAKFPDSVWHPDSVTGTSDSWMRRCQSGNILYDRGVTSLSEGHDVVIAGVCFSGKSLFGSIGAVLLWAKSASESIMQRRHHQSFHVRSPLIREAFVARPFRHARPGSRRFMCNWFAAIQRVSRSVIPLVIPHDTHFSRITPRDKDKIDRRQHKSYGPPERCQKQRLGVRSQAISGQ